MIWIALTFFGGLIAGVALTVAAVIAVAIWLESEDEKQFARYP